GGGWPVPLGRLDRHEPGVLEGSQQPAQVAGVEPEPCPDGTQVRAVVADLPQEPRLAEWTVGREEVVVERTHALADDPVEPADLSDGGLIHSLTLVRERSQINSR